MLVVVYAATSLLMQRVMRRVNAPHPEFEAEFKVEMKSRDGKPQQPDMAQQMQKQMGMMNLMIFVFAFIFSAGALLYFAVQNLLMTLEYTILPRGMALSFDAKEMKAFVRRPPPPLRGTQTEVRGGQVQDSMRDTALTASGGGSAVQDDTAINQADDLGAAETAVPGVLRRPRRKKRKR
jgi:membrane protein insertase Oxa1/YidC/SpoIIIJ